MATVGAAGSKPSRRSERARRLTRRREIDQRMADELHRHARLAVDRFLERKDHQHAIGDRADRLQPPGAPRPDLRADVVDDRNAERADAARQRKVEVRESR